MVNYRIVVKNADGTEVGEFETFRNLKLNKRLNNYGTCSFEIKANDTKANSLISLRRFTIWIYREESGSSVLVWSGEQAMREGNLNENADNWVTIHCFDWLEQLNSRYTAAEKSFTQVDAGQIAWELIDETQDQVNGDFGITQGTIEATTDRDRTYYNQNIMEAIIGLANVLSGFDFEISNDRVFNVYILKGVDRTDSVVFEYGFNMASVKVIEDFINPINRAIVLGESVSYGYDQDLQRVDRDDVTSQALYKVREGRLSEMDVSEIETLQEKGDAMLRKYGTALLKIDMNLVKGHQPSIVDFSLGDLIGLKIQSGIYDIDEAYRVYEWEVVFDDDNTEQLSLVLGKFIV